MKLTVTKAIGAGALAAAFSATSAFADEERVIKSEGGKYTETRQGDGSQYKYESDGVRSVETYQDKNGAQMKRESNGIETKSQYQDKDCQRKASENVATGDSEIVAKGNCE